MGRELPVVDPPASPRDRDGQSDSRVAVAGVLLAAGTSRRFGDENKLLTSVDGEPMVRRSARTLLDAGLDPILVVVGHQSSAVRDALAGLGVEFVENPAYEAGQASSLRAGVSQLSSGLSVREPADAAVFALGDMPYIDPESVRALVAAYEAGLGSALASGFEGERGNPVLFDRSHFSALSSAGGDVGGRSVLLGAPDAAIVETGDPGVRRDIDDPGGLDSE